VPRLRDGELRPDESSGGGPADGRPPAAWGARGLAGEDGRAAAGVPAGRGAPRRRHGQIGYLKHKLLDSFLAPLATLRYPPLDGNSAELMLQTYSKLLGQVGWKLRPKPKASDDMGCKHAAIAAALHGLGKLVVPAPAFHGIGQMVGLEFMLCLRVDTLPTTSH